MDRHQIIFPEKHLALREDVHQLGMYLEYGRLEEGCVRYIAEIAALLADEVQPE